MTLAEMLERPGTHVWAFTRDTPIKTVADAERRLQSYLTRPKFANTRATAHGVLISGLRNYTCEPGVMIEVEVVP